MNLIIVVVIAFIVGSAILVLGLCRAAGLADEHAERCRLQRENEEENEEWEALLEGQPRKLLG